MDLYMMLLGCKPRGRRTEQHDIFFGVGTELRDFVPAILEFWPEADQKVHIDAYRTVTWVDGYHIAVVPREEMQQDSELKLYFVNLGGYKENEFEEYHFKRVVVAKSLAEAIVQAKATVFWQHHVSPHIDDKYGLDVDDIYEIEDLLPDSVKEKFGLTITPDRRGRNEDIVKNGYFKLSAL